MKERERERARRTDKEAQTDPNRHRQPHKNTKTMRITNTQTDIKQKTNAVSEREISTQNFKRLRKEKKRKEINGYNIRTGSSTLDRNPDIANTFDLNATVLELFLFFFFLSIFFHNPENPNLV